MHVSLLPVFSKLADPADVARETELARLLPANIQLSQHQLETYRALLNREVNVVINTAMTGDGKSLAGLLPLLVDGYHTMALYPTNELLRDQYVHATSGLPGWKRNAGNVGMLYGAHLDDMAVDAEFGNRGALVNGLLANHQLVLSNPDILHAILQFSYVYGRAPDWLAGQLSARMNQLTFDEFHIFDESQVAAVLTGLMFLYAQRGPYPFKTLFLSATPGDVLIPLLQRAGFDEQQVRLVQGSYSYDEQADPDAWRSILQPATLHLSPLSASDWIAAHFEDRLLRFFQQHGKHAKGAIIVNSVARAHQLLDELQPRLAPHHITVLPNTGLTGRTTRQESRFADLLIGTATVDVGVDFQINYLVFEASDANTFMQRLGRLGRHRKYTDAAGTTHPFDVFEAHALLPSFAYERLAVSNRGEPPLLQAESTLNRHDLREAVDGAFLKPASYRSYLRTWGRFQPAHVLYKLSRSTIQETYAEVVKQLRERYYKLFNVGMQKTINDVRDLSPIILEEARSFRGGSPFDCGVLMPNEDEPLTYNLLWLVVNADMEQMSKNAFLAEVRRRKQGNITRPYEQDRENKRWCAFFRILRFRPDRLQITIDLDRARKMDWATTAYGTAQEIQGIQIDCSYGTPDWLFDVNEKLSKRKVVGVIVPGCSPEQVQREVYLPGMFPLYRFRGNGFEGTIAFGRYALLLDSRLREKRLNCSDSAMVI